MKVMIHLKMSFIFVHYRLMKGFGYGTKIMMSLPQYVQGVFPDFNHLYLVVDAENDNAWNLYERAGFMHTATKEEGPIGKDYLDLDSKHVSSLKLEEESRSEVTNVHIINLMIDGQRLALLHWSRLVNA